jgi:ribulose-5-phosphate 4-epimerase/fuculose-1-phosphate aldolase
MSALFELKMIENLIKYAHKAKEAGLVISSSGNISMRLDAGRFAISSSGAYLGELGKKDISICYMDEKKARGDSKSSIETPLHRAIYIERPDVNAILHFQSLYATTLACAKGFDFNLNFIPEIPAYIKKVQVLPYFNPGSARLAQEVRRKIKDSDCNMLVLKNHGQIAIGKDLKSVLRSAEFFEFACKIACQGIELKRYGRKIIKELRNYDKA